MSSALLGTSSIHTCADLSQADGTFPALNKTTELKQADSIVRDGKASSSIELQSWSSAVSKYLPLIARSPDKALWICCLRNMDIHFGGLAMPVSAARYANLTKLLETMTEALRPHVLLTSAIKRIYRIDGSPINSLEDLCEGDFVVCCCAYENFEKIEYKVARKYIRFLGTLIRREDKRNLRIAKNARFRDMQISELPASITAYIDIRSVFFRSVLTVIFKGYGRSKYNPYIVKAVNKSSLLKHCAVYKEIEIIRRLQGHPNITELIYTVEQKHRIFIVLERLDGDLIKFLENHGPFSEALIRNMISQVSSGILFMHNANIVHCDIKLDNLLVSYQSVEGEVKLQQIKIVDFGLAVYYNGTKLHGSCGTPLYMAPELLLGDGFDPRIDVWSLGVVTYFLLFLKFPFGSIKMDDESVFSCTIEIMLEFPADSSVSAAARHFITAVLQKDPLQRLTSADMDLHRFLKPMNTARS